MATEARETVRVQSVHAFHPGFQLRSRSILSRLLPRSSILSINRFFVPRVDRSLEVRIEIARDVPASMIFREEICGGRGKSDRKNGFVRMSAEV